jgi:hypothetical protein
VDWFCRRGAIRILVWNGSWLKEENNLNQLRAEQASISRHDPLAQPHQPRGTIHLVGHHQKMNSEG